MYVSMMLTYETRLKALGCRGIAIDEEVSDTKKRSLHLQRKGGGSRLTPTSMTYHHGMRDIRQVEACFVENLTDSSLRE